MSKTHRLCVDKMSRLECLNLLRRGGVGFVLSRAAYRRCVDTCHSICQSHINATLGIVRSCSDPYDVASSPFSPPPSMTKPIRRSLRSRSFNLFPFLVETLLYNEVHNNVSQMSSVYETADTVKPTSAMHFSLTQFSSLRTRDPVKLISPSLELNILQQESQDLRRRLNYNSLSRRTVRSPPYLQICMFLCSILIHDMRVLLKIDLDLISTNICALIFSLSDLLQNRVKG
ncbi:hypothetical protein L249_6890 [Ophiocordyceps polyrhachis-furcata BCC 54312]|uniref:Uncharacterized protein n=1 Tax=Ophiocordyceps polyrhachis-furcata BCC 54312 TaxID=1330021 RepID=A0A367LJU6_9HYPO|nr:hypothetical protein L249_6890 [Ophiocordyceps polyrhachis-furcata BCC 54312]